MQQTESFNGGAHGNIHGLLGGTWSAEADEYAAKTPDIVLPFVHHVYVRFFFLRRRETNRPSIKEGTSLSTKETALQKKLFLVVYVCMLRKLELSALYMNCARNCCATDPKKTRNFLSIAATGQEMQLCAYNGRHVNTINTART